MESERSGAIRHPRGTAMTCNTFLRAAYIYITDVDVINIYLKCPEN